MGRPKAKNSAKNEKKIQIPKKVKNLTKSQSKPKVTKQKVVPKAAKAKTSSSKTNAKDIIDQTLSVQLMKREAELNNTKTLPLSTDSKKWLMFGTQITKNLYDQTFVVRVIVNGGNYVEFDWESYDKLFNIPKDYNYCVQQKVQRTIMKSEKLQVDVYTKNHTSWFMSFTDDNGSNVSLVESDISTLLSHRNVIFNDYTQFKAKKEDAIKKFDLLQNLIAYNLNNRTVNNSMNLITLKNMPKKEFNSLVQMVDDLWAKIQKVM